MGLIFVGKGRLWTLSSSLKLRKLDTEGDTATKRPRWVYYISIGVPCGMLMGHYNISRRGLTALLILLWRQCEGLRLG